MTDMRQGSLVPSYCWQVIISVGTMHASFSTNAPHSQGSHLIIMVINNTTGLVVPPRKALTFLDLELDVTSYLVRRNGHPIHLTPTAFRLLLHLMKDPHRVYSRPELKNAAWPDAVHVGPRTVDVHIGHLRAALNQAGGLDLIRTVRSVGYALSKEARPYRLGSRQEP